MFKIKKNAKKTLNDREVLGEVNNASVQLRPSSQRRPTTGKYRSNHRPTASTNELPPPTPTASMQTLPPPPVDREALSAHIEQIVERLAENQPSLNTK